MKKIVPVTLSILTLLALALTACVLLNKNQSSNYSIRNFQELTLSNGLSVILIKDKTLPYFSLRMLIGVGSSSDPSSQHGLASVVGRSLNKGSLKRSALQIAEELDFQGSQFSIRVNKDFTQVGLSGLAMYKKQALKIFSEVITQPAFSKNELTRLIKQTQSHLKSITDNPSQIPKLIFNKYIYLNHPYAHPALGSQKALTNIQKEDVLSFYKKYYNSKNMWLSVIGNFEDSILSELEKHFGAKALPSGERPFLADSQIPHNNRLRIILINKPDLKQAQIVMGHLGIRRNNLNHLKLKIVNTVLSRDTQSRLNNEIRVKRGLTYSISSRFNSLKDRGTFFISTFTQPKKVGETISETLKVITQLKENGISKEELNLTQSYLKGSFPKILETAESLAGNLLYLKFHALSYKYLTNYASNIQKISLQEVNKELPNYFHPSKMTIVVYAPSRLVRKQLKKIGPVTEIQHNDLKF